MLNIIFSKKKYPIDRYKNKTKGIKFYHELKIQINNRTEGFISDININSFDHGDFKRFDRFIKEINKVFKIEYIEEMNF